MWPRRDLLNLLGLEHPIVQAPMAGYTTPDLAAAVANAGGLGSIGCTTMSPAQVRDTIVNTRARTNRAFNLNFLLYQEPTPHPERARRMQAHLEPYFRELGLGDVPAPEATIPMFDEGRLEVLLELRPPCVSFHFGLPAPHLLGPLRDAGIKVLSSATTVAEARALEDAGVDVIVAQGADAGGHRGVFDPDQDAAIGTMALVPQVVDAVGVPVVAAGGIADGRAIAAAFALGASGVQMGTAFLNCPEASTPPAHRRRLESARDDETRITRLISGRPARLLRNRLVDELQDRQADAAPYPTQLAMVAPLREASARRGDDEFIPLWAGQAAALTRSMPAADLVQVLVAEVRTILDRPNA
jgi:nitronate monooxygenase